MKTIFVLSTIILGRKTFVASHMNSRSWDKKKIVHYTSDVAYAKDFGSTIAAEAFIEKIVNPHERTYNAETVEVDEQLLKAAELVMEEDLK